MVMMMMMVFLYDIILFFQVIIGSTQILKPDDIFKRVFCQDNLFPTIT